MATTAAGSPLEPWTPGTLEIHQLATGRGNCALVLAPDGTSYVIDVGETHRFEHTVTALKPDASRRPGQWAARYVGRRVEAVSPGRVDYMIATHFHGDHIGEVGGETGAVGPTSVNGEYALTGITDFAEEIEIGLLVDRGHPDYSYPAALDDPTATNYRAFVREREAAGGRVERLVVGSTSQLAARSPDAHPAFEVRGIAANGEVWTGAANGARSHFPQLSGLSGSALPSENMCSLALRFSYGPFRFYTGGDLSCSDDYGAAAWRDIETPVARAAGPVDVAVLNHHGYVDAVGAGFVAALRPRIFIVPAWDSCHPTISVLARLLSRSLYPGDRDVFVTNMMDENRIVNRRLRECASQDGHIVIRVAERGETYEVLVVGNEDENDTVIARHGPFVAGQSGA